jgi:metal-responsive CopG/Arc/MetJ family transcriptional regulator
MAKIKIDNNLMARLQSISAQAGYSNVDEFITHVLEKELEKIESADDEKTVQERLRGLGYLQ